MTIFEALTENADKRLPMHMPGHKRRAEAEYLKKLACDLDITEIDGFDDLSAPTGIIAEAQDRAAALYGAERSFFLVGGSTVGILAGIYTILSPGDTVLLARNCHKSVYNAVEICGGIPEYILPERDENGIFSSVEPDDIRRALEGRKARLVVVTSPTYEGVISDIAAIKAVCRENGAVLLVDAAHGAHLDLSEYFVGGAVKAGADITVCSLHKTLPSLTQTAVAHINGIDGDRFQRSLSVFQTSSPSYLLLASADGCIDLINRHPEYFKRWSEALSCFYDKASHISHLRTFTGGGSFGFDKSKIVVTTGGYVTGFDLAARLRLAGIEPEMAAEGYTVCMTGMFDGEKELDALYNALSEIDSELFDEGEKRAYINFIPEYRLSPKEATSLSSVSVPADAASGRVSAEYIYAYPPGIPLIVPGEVFSDSVISCIKSALSSGAMIISSDKSHKTFKVLSI